MMRCIRKPYFTPKRDPQQHTSQISCWPAHAPLTPSKWSFSPLSFLPSVRQGNLDIRSLFCLLFLKNYIYLFLAVLSLCGRMGFSLVAGSWGQSPVAMLGLLTAVASLVAGAQTSVVAA